MRAVRLPAMQRPGHQPPNYRSQEAFGGATPELAASGSRIRRDPRGPAPKGNGSKTKPVLLGALVSDASLQCSVGSIANRVHVLEHHSLPQTEHASRSEHP